MGGGPPSPSRGSPGRLMLLRLVCLAIVASATGREPSVYSCPFRQLAHTYAAQVLGGRGLSRVAAGLNLSSSSGGCAAVHAAATARSERPAAGLDFLRWSTVNRSTESLRHTVFVDPQHGADENDGTFARPVRTLRAAQLAARRHAGEGATVVLRKGVHRGPLRLSPMDSNVRWTSHESEIPIISGGVPLVGLRWKRGDGDVWAARLPAHVPAFKALYVDGLREIRARYPNVADPTLPGGFGLEDGRPLNCPANTVPEQYQSNIQVVSAGNASIQLYSGATMDGVLRTISVDKPTLATLRPSWRNFGGCFNGSSRRFDETYSVDHWGSESIQGVVNSSQLGALPRWTNASTAIVHMMHPGQWGNWMFSVADRPQPGALRFACQSLDGRKRLPCTTQGPTEQVMVIGGWQEARGACVGKTDGGLEWSLPSFKWPFYVENVRELCDSPREWFLDEARRTLYYRPSDDSIEPSTLEFVAAVSASAVQIRGSAAKPVRDVSLSGFTIAHTAPTFMEKYEVPSGGDWSVHRNAAVFIEGASNIAVSGLLFDQPGGNAIMLSNSVRYSSVVNCSFISCGDSAILSVGSSRLMNGTGDQGLFPTRNLIQGNLVDTVGVFGKETSAYFKSMSDSNIVRNNVFQNGPRAGVNFNDGGAGGEVLEGNLVFNFVRETGDHGMFNSWDRQPLLYTDESGSVSIVPKTHQLRHNFIFNSNFGEGGTNSGYCVDWDDASSEYNATDNVLVFGGFKLSGGSNRAVSGNLVVDGKLVDPQQAGCCPTPAEQAKVLSINTTTVFGNTAVHSQGAFYSCASPLPIGWWAQHGNRFYNNTFYTPGNPNLPFKPSGCTTNGTTLAQWQAHGSYFDRGSTISSDITVAQLLALAKRKLGIQSE